VDGETYEDIVVRAVAYMYHTSIASVGKMLLFLQRGPGERLWKRTVKLVN